MASTRDADRLVAVLRLGTAVATILTLTGPGSRGLGAGRGLSWSVLLHAAVAVSAGLTLLLISRRPGPVRATVGAAALVADISAYLVHESQWHTITGAGTLLGILLVVEAPLRFGTRGAVLVALPVLLQVQRWPQVDDRGHGAPFSTSAGLLLLITGLSCGVLVLVHRSTARQASQLSQAAHTDPLTGVANRSRLLEELGALLATGAGNCAVLFVDVDRFKPVNDALGHAAGDALLIEVAHRLQAQVRPQDLVTRMGGDEFVVLCRDVHSAAEPVAIAHRIVAALASPASVPGGEVVIGASIGIALPSCSARRPLDVVSDADTAMYRAKQAGGGQVEVFTPELRRQAQHHLELETALRQALQLGCRDGALSVAYQPVVGLLDGRIHGVEALLRWDHPTLGVVSPTELVELAEGTALVHELGAWVMRQALGDSQRWRLASSPPRSLEVCVNVSVKELERPGYVARVAEILKETGVCASQVCLEVTETALVRSVETVAEVMGELRELGLRLAIDDFGTGHASLTYLARFPVDIVKIDKSFVAGLGQQASSAAIVGSIVTLAHALHMQVVAEGVENLAQLELLLDTGCDLAQGHLFAHALAYPQATEVIATAAPWPVERRQAAGAGGDSADSRALSATSPARRYRLLLDLARDVTGSLDLDSVLQRTFTGLRQLVDFDGCSIQLIHDGDRDDPDDGKHLRLAATIPPATPEALSARLPLGTGIGGRIAATGEPRWIDDVLLDPDVPPALRAQATSGGVRSYYGVPLIAEGSVLGLLQMDSTSPHAFNEEDCVVVLAFSPIVAAAVQNARAFEREAATLGFGPARSGDEDRRTDVHHAEEAVVLRHVHPDATVADGLADRTRIVGPVQADRGVEVVELHEVR
jgi:diguanylate cyclase (GGDEF)-like protein